jgi:hypothetical protein
MQLLHSFAGPVILRVECVFKSMGFVRVGNSALGHESHFMSSSVRVVGMRVSSIILVRI